MSKSSAYPNPFTLTQSLTPTNGQDISITPDLTLMATGAYISGNKALVYKLYTTLGYTLVSTISVMSACLSIQLSDDGIYLFLACSSSI
jgi:hypothetical protein